MIGKTLALTLRSIREDTRLLRTHLFRLFLLLLVMWMLYLTQQDDLGRGAPGLEFFHALIWINFIFISLMGITFFASAITEEKEEMTLGLLRMAGIGPLALLFGKMLPRLFAAVLLLSVQYPFTLLAVTLGGVTSDQVAAAYFTLVSYSLLLAGVALFFSVACQATRSAAFMTTISIGSFLFFPWWLTKAIPWKATGPLETALHAGLSLIYQASPMLRIIDIMQTNFLQPGAATLWMTQDSPFGFQAQADIGAAIVLFFLSWGTFNWFNRDERPASPMRAMTFRSSSKLRRLVGGRVWGNALLWKDLHFIAGGPMMLLVKGGLYLIVIVGLIFFVAWMNGGRLNMREYATWNIGLGLLLFLIEGALLASNVFRQEVKWKTLPSLVMLPGSLIYKSYSKIAGCLLGLLPSFAWFAFGVLCNAEEFFRDLGDVLNELGFWFTVMNYVLLLHLAAFLSLFVKWMAFPLSVGIVIATNAFCLMTMYIGGGARDEGPLVVMIFLTGFAAIVLHIGIGERLRTLACR